MGGNIHNHEKRMMAIECPSFTCSEMIVRFRATSVSVRHERGKDARDDVPTKIGAVPAGKSMFPQPACFRFYCKSETDKRIVDSDHVVSEHNRANGSSTTTAAHTGHKAQNDAHKPTAGRKILAHKRVLERLRRD